MTTQDLKNNRNEIIEKIKELGVEDIKTFMELLVMDVDFFKQYNDTYGHQKGDLALERVANILKKKTYFIFLY